jgi:hypothetical protein
MSDPSKLQHRYLPFKSSEAAFEFACKLHPDEVRDGSGHVGRVLDSRALLGAQEAVKLQDDGRQLAVLKIANSDGGFIVPAKTAVKNAPPLRPGDLVLWVAGTYLPQIAETLGDKREGWVGLIVGVLSPEMEVDTGAFRVSLDYRDLPS